MLLFVYGSQRNGGKTQYSGYSVLSRRLFYYTRDGRSKRFFATTGQPYTREGVAHSEDATLAARNALLNMIDHLVDERGYTRQQAYAICSVAVDLKVSELVDVPNFLVSAFCRSIFLCKHYETHPSRLHENGS